jgi:DNA replication protein DnaC
MYGNVGTDSSFNRGVEACKREFEVAFYRTTALVNKLAEHKKAGTLSTFLKKLSKADLLICDEWGYVPLDRIGAQLLFEVISVLRLYRLGLLPLRLSGDNSPQITFIRFSAGSHKNHLL